MFHDTFSNKLLLNFKGMNLKLHPRVCGFSNKTIHNFCLRSFFFCTFTLFLYWWLTIGHMTCLSQCDQYVLSNTDEDICRKPQKSTGRVLDPVLMVNLQNNIKPKTQRIMWMRKITERKSQRVIEFTVKPHP